MEIPPLTSGTPPKDRALQRAAQELEAGFLAEMLRAAGLGKSPETFGGGAGEDQFSSFLVQEQAKAIAAKGGIGLAETIFESLKGTENGQ